MNGYAETMTKLLDSAIEELEASKNAADHESRMQHMARANSKLLAATRWADKYGSRREG